MVPESFRTEKILPSSHSHHSHPLPFFAHSNHPFRILRDISAYISHKGRSWKRRVAGSIGAETPGASLVWSELSNFSWDLLGWLRQWQNLSHTLNMYILYTSRGEDAERHRFGSRMLFSTTSAAVYSFLKACQDLIRKTQAPSVSKICQPLTPT